MYTTNLWSDPWDRTVSPKLQVVKFMTCFASYSQRYLIFYSRYSNSYPWEYGAWKPLLDKWYASITDKKKNRKKNSHRNSYNWQIKTWVWHCWFFSGSVFTSTSSARVSSPGHQGWTIDSRNLPGRLQSFVRANSRPPKSDAKTTNPQPPPFRSVRVSPFHLQIVYRVWCKCTCQSTLNKSSMRYNQRGWY